MKKFDNIDSLHAYLERIADKTIKFYYTDWKNYDRPALMKATGNKEIIYIIFRESGSYLYNYDELCNYDFSRVVMDYYKNYSDAKYYKVDLLRLTAEKIPAGIPEEITRSLKAA